MAIETTGANSRRREDIPPVRFADSGPPSSARHIVFYRRDALSFEMMRQLEAAAPSERLALAEPWLDAGHGDGDLTDKAVAASLSFAIRNSNGKYDLLSWCIMPSHVHVLIVVRADEDVTRIVRGWMESAGHFGAPGSPHPAPLIWEPRFFADVISGNTLITTVARHIEGNPVAAGLARSPETWPWSSATGAIVRRQPPRRLTALPPSPAPPPVATRRATHVIIWLNDALPEDVFRGLAGGAPDDRPLVLDRTLDKALDKGRGRRSFASRTAAAEMRTEILAGDGVRYGLIAWCVMPTHVHVLLSEMPDSSLVDIVALWKARTIRAANVRRYFRTDASPWAAAYSSAELIGDDDIEDAKSYIEYNPVINRLTRTPEAWRWSSASRPHRKAGGT